MPSLKMYYYAVNKGRTPGVYTSWAQCAAQVHGYSNAVYQKFSTLAEAEEFVVGAGSQATRASLTSVPTASLSNIIVVEPGEWDAVHCEAHQREDGSVGVGVWWGEDNPKNLSERCPGLESLERGELVAVVRALENLPSGDTSLLVKTESLRCISHIEKCVQIMKAEGQVEGVASHNMPLSLYIPRLLARIRRQGRRIRLQQVNTHRVTDEYGTQMAKSLANCGTQQEGGQRIWALREESNGEVDDLQRSLASLEIEV